MSKTLQRSVTVAAVTSEPLSLDEAKKHLEVAEDDPSHDLHVDGLIEAVRELWEHDTQSLFVTRSVTEKMHQWPSPDWKFYYKPESVTSVNYYDTAGGQQALASSVYSDDLENRRLLLSPDQSWPSVQDRWDAITIMYQAGIATEIAKSAMKLQLDVMFELRGMTKEKDSCIKAYERLVERFMRSSYP